LAAAAVITLLIILGYGIFRLNNVFTGERLRVAVVQGNIPQDQKWDRRFTDMILSRYEDLTQKAALEKPDLIIWPESSIPGFVENEEELTASLRALLKNDLERRQMGENARRVLESNSGAAKRDFEFIKILI